jgi:hypothetical protein
MASAATSMNHAMAGCPFGMMIAAAISGPIAEPVLPPTWNIDCAVPKRPPEARRAMREASGWKVDDPTPMSAAETSSVENWPAMDSRPMPTRVTTMPIGSR